MRKLRYQILPSLVAYASTSAQIPSKPALGDSSVPAIMRHAGTGRDSPTILAVLRNAQGRLPRAKQDMIADSLIARAISNHGRSGLASDSAAYGAALRAVVTLGHAGMATYAGMDDGATTPYAGALDGLIRISQNAPVRGIRSRALSLILRQRDRRRAIGYVRQVAQLSTDDGYDAAFALLREATGLTELPPPTKAERDKALAILRELDQKHLASNPLVAQKLPDWIRSVTP